MHMAKVPSRWTAIAAIAVAVGVVGCGRDRQSSGDAATPAVLDSRAPASSASTTLDPYLVSANGIGGIRLGMTLDEARRALPDARFERTSDGDGAALVEVRLGPNAAMTIWADEGDAEAPIDWSREVRVIETFSPEMHTTDGVHPGSLVTEVETVLGKTKTIEKSEIESREYIVFENQPVGLTFRLDYTGIFPADSQRTREFAPGGKIHSIAVSSYTTE